jgi:hypothetical protein
LSILISSVRSIADFVQRFQDALCNTVCTGRMIRKRPVALSNNRTRHSAAEAGFSVTFAVWEQRLFSESKNRSYRLHFHFRNVLEFSIASNWPIIRELGGAERVSSVSEFSVGPESKNPRRQQCLNKNETLLANLYILLPVQSRIRIMASPAGSNEASEGCESASVHPDHRLTN